MSNEYPQVDSSWDHPTEELDETQKRLRAYAEQARRNQPHRPVADQPGDNVFNHYR